jgi:hypothetical protein
MPTLIRSKLELLMSSNNGGATCPRLMIGSELSGRLNCQLSYLDPDMNHTIPRLWHNVTVMLMHFAGKPDTGPYLVELFEKLVGMGFHITILHLTS